MKQHLIPASIAAVVAASIAGGVAHYAPVKQVVHSIALSKHAWGDLTDLQKADLVQRLAPLKGVKIEIICADAACTDLAQDIDDACERAGVDSVLDRPMLPLGYGIGIQAEAGDPRAAQLVVALTAVTDAKIETIIAPTAASGYPLWIVIGKHR